jgi:uncharacterized protein YcbK (DUF882 family)
MDDLLKRNNEAGEAYQADRRGFLKHGLIFTAALGFWMPAVAEASIPSMGAPRKGRSLQFTNVHTGEAFSGEYWYDGKYVPGAFSEIKTILRDFRTGDKFPIDPRLMDVLYVLQHRTGNMGKFNVFSGYRSPHTNGMLRETSGGVARGSLHMQGQAIDVNLPGTSLPSLRKTAINLKSGGVGYYPKSQFVHIDTGRARTW